jgi:aerobic carbon-monoxide dehydrogenase medium subunit
MLAVGAELKIIGPKGERQVAAASFFVGPMTTVIEATEILTEIRVPVSVRRSGSAYLKAAQQASGFAVVGIAVSLRVDNKGSCEEIGIGVTGLTDKPFRAQATERQLRGSKVTLKLIEAAAAHVADGVDPLEDLHANAQYRGHLARVYTSRAIQAAAKKALGRLS